MDGRRYIAKDLTAAIWNANGLRHKKLEIERFIQAHKIDVLMVNETHLRGGERFNLRNMLGYRDDSVNRQRGGTAIFIRRSLIHHRLETPPLNNIEATAVTAPTAAGTITFVASYLHPHTEMLQQDVEALTTLNERTLIGGDLNSKHQTWNSRVNNRNGNRLLPILDALELEVHATEEPTYYPFNHRHRPDVLDIVLTKNIAAEVELTAVNDLSSDHIPVVIKLNRATWREANRVTSTVDWDYYRRLLSNSVRPTLTLDTVNDVKTAVDYLTSKISAASRRATILTAREDPRETEWPPLLAELHHQKNRYRRRWQQYRNPRDRRTMHRLQRELQVRLQEWRRERWEDKMEAFHLHHKEEWELVRALRNSPTPKRAIHTEHGLTFEPLHIAEAFADAYERQNILPNYQLAADELRETERTIQFVEEFRRRPPTTLPLLTTPSEVRRIISQRKGQSAPGVDKITNSHLKELPRKPIVLLTRIFNRCLQLGHFPERWKIARVSPIPKPGKDLAYPNNYRPISLLSTLSKIFERALLPRIQQPLLADGTIRLEQFGFQKRLSAELQVLRVVEHIANNLNTSTSTAAAFLDWDKAYDRVWHERLIYKLATQTSIPDCYVHLIDDYLQGRRIQVTVEDQTSSQRALSAGIPQGSVLSPTLFNIFINDLPKDNNILLAQFADDTALLTSCRQHGTNVTRLQRQLDKVVKWCRTNGVVLNAEKTKVVYFSKKRPRLDQIVIHGHRLPWSPSVRYLGVELDSGLFFHRHVQAKKRTCTQMAKALVPFFISEQLNQPTKLRLYKTTVLSALLYGSTAWGIASKTQLGSLQVVQNKVLRWILRAPPWERIRDMHEATEMDTILVAIKKKARKLYDKIDRLRETIPQVREIGTRQPRPGNRFKVPLNLLDDEALG